MPDVGRRWHLTCLVCCLALAGCSSGGSGRTRFTVSSPAVVGPIPSTSTDFPFIADRVWPGATGPARL